MNGSVTSQPVDDEGSFGVGSVLQAKLPVTSRQVGRYAPPRLTPCVLYSFQSHVSFKAGLRA